MIAPPSRLCSTWNILGGFWNTGPDLACSRWCKCRGFWNIAPQPGLKKSRRHAGGMQGRCSPVGPPSGSAARLLRRYGIHVHPCGMQKADRSSVKAPMGPWRHPAGPRDSTATGGRCRSTGSRAPSPATVGSWPRSWPRNFPLPHDLPTSHVNARPASHRLDRRSRSA